jgi:hypothetical protein
VCATVTADRGDANTRTCYGFEELHMSVIELERNYTIWSRLCTPTGVVETDPMSADANFVDLLSDLG